MRDLTSTRPAIVSVDLSALVLREDGLERELLRVRNQGLVGGGGGGRGSHGDSVVGGVGYRRGRLEERLVREVMVIAGGEGQGEVVHASGRGQALPQPAQPVTRPRPAMEVQHEPALGRERMLMRLLMLKSHY